MSFCLSELRRTRLSLPNVTSVVLLVLLAVLYLTPTGDLDYAILIRQGEVIVRTGELRPAESFSYTIAGQEVPDFEWLFEVGLWVLWSWSGSGGVKLLKVLLVVATLVVLGLRLRAEGAGWPGIILSVGLAALMLSSVWNLRPLYFTTLGLLLVSWWLHDHCTDKRQVGWELPLYMLFWGNVHPGVITGQGLLAGAIAWEWLNRWSQLNPPLDLARCWRLTWFGVLGLAATFLSPDSLGRLLAPFQPEVRHPIMQIFTEMQPLWRVALEQPWPFTLPYVLALVVLLTVILRLRHYRLWEVALLVGTTGLANLAIRSLQDWVLVMLALGVPHLLVLLKTWREAGRRRWWVRILRRVHVFFGRLLQAPLFHFQPFWPAFGLALLTVISLIPPLARDMPIRDGPRYPAAAVDWIRDNLPGAEPWKIFAPPDYSTYLVWRLGERVRIYADTRGFCFPSELVADAHHLPLMTSGWQQRLERVLRLGTQYLLLEVQGPRGALGRELGATLKPLYHDGQAVLFEAEAVRRWWQGLQRQQAGLGRVAGPALSGARGADVSPSSGLTRESHNPPGAATLMSAPGA